MSTGQRSSVPHKKAVRTADIAERAEATRAALVAAGRRLFVEKGYFATGTEEIVAAAEVGTRGALYHHFPNKKALFLAVFLEVEEELHSQAPHPDETEDALLALRNGLRAYLKSSQTGEVQRILLVDGPAVLGWQQWRELQVQYGLGSIRALLERAMQQGTVTQQPVDVLAHVLLAATDEAAQFIANADDPQRAREDAVIVIDRLLENLG
ncbi:bacterial regulatory s, tetR family protein [Mycolicibacterium hassiacum DSM 44199]|jgi:AcrR family transcriptional regulator|uniref:Bacterial regulatory s, tetR family protein n=2 Tax=Mycobacteriaceae TaxID=1762 RepID=K5BIH9_MYCHD|nr:MULTISPECIES: TetR/AcrR family transcriptional regulator [Mycolicibacterium]EKF21394.1 bacterial regulatory s, tetR family protein [Mycolicibacterium hassiacum DSM 44199]VCT91416.1 Transposon Tn10 TetC protein [Mycolicibacterium hassiacum DSM 44199]